MQLLDGERGHGRTAADSEYDQRHARLLDAMLAEVGGRGYSGTSVAHVIRRAGLSRKTFYEHFANREDCFVQAYDAVLLRLHALLDATRAGDGPLDARVERGLSTLLHCCAEQPALARTCIVEVLAAGPGARARRDATILEIARLIEPSGDSERPSVLSEAVAGGVYGVLYSRIARGETEQLPQLLEELMGAGLRQLAAAAVA